MVNISGVIWSVPSADPQPTKFEYGYDKNIGMILKEKAKMEKWTFDLSKDVVDENKLSQIVISDGNKVITVPYSEIIKGSMLPFPLCKVQAISIERNDQNMTDQTLHVYTEDGFSRDYNLNDIIPKYFNPFSVPDKKIIQNDDCALGSSDTSKLKLPHDKWSFEINEDQTIHFQYGEKWFWITPTEFLEKFDAYYKTKYVESLKNYILHAEIHELNGNPHLYIMNKHKDNKQVGFTNYSNFNLNKHAPILFADFIKQVDATNEIKKSHVKSQSQIQYKMGSNGDSIYYYDGRGVAISCCSIKDYMEYLAHASFFVPHYKIDHAFFIKKNTVNDKTYYTLVQNYNNNDYELSVLDVHYQNAINYVRLRDASKIKEQTYMPIDYDSWEKDYNELRALRKEVEQLHVQLAGCSVAALGGTKPEVVAQKGDYGWSPSYQDILDLRLKYEFQLQASEMQAKSFQQLYEANEALKKEIKKLEAINGAMNTDNKRLFDAAMFEAKRVDVLEKNIDKLQNRAKESNDELEKYMNVLYTEKLKMDELRNKSLPNMLKNDAYNALYRVGATQMMNALKSAIIALLRTAGKNNETIKVISDILDTDVGTAILSCVCGYSVTNLVEDNEIAEKFAQELRVYGISVAGNAAFESLFEALTSSIIPILKSIEDKKEEENKQEPTLYLVK